MLLDIAQASPFRNGYAGRFRAMVAEIAWIAKKNNE